MVMTYVPVVVRAFPITSQVALLALVPIGMSDRAFGRPWNELPLLKV